MKRAWKLLIILVFLFISFSLTDNAYADMGPKSSSEFEFIFQDEQILIISGKLYLCDDSSCSEPYWEVEWYPGGFSCGEKECSSFAFEADFHFLEIEFSDGVTRRSNIFTKEHFEAFYEVLVFEDHLEVVETGGKVNIFNTIILMLLFFLSGTPLYYIVITFLAGNDVTGKLLNKWYKVGWIVGIPPLLVVSTKTITLPLTMMFEIVLGNFYVNRKKLPKFKLLTFIFIGNLITQILLYVNAVIFNLPLFNLLIAEVAIVLIESCIFYFSHRKQISFWEALGLSFGLNSITFVIGLIIPF